MNNSEEFDKLLKQALSPTEKPSEDLNFKIINQLKEKDKMKPTYKKRFSVAFITAVLVLAMSVTAFAAWRLLSPKQVAEKFGDPALASAFEAKGSIEINKSTVSGGYNFTLLGIVSGKNLSEFKSSAQDINPDRTYAVVSIAKTDGSKMPDTKDEEYGKVPFFVSPLIKGQKPWQCNIASMNGSYSECVVDGIMYRLIECDGIEMFADRGLYLCISTSNFYDIKAFNYNEQTGEVTINKDYSGANALFDLPLDKSKADHEKAEKYLQDLLKPSTDNKAVSASETAAYWEKEFANGVVVPGSAKKVTRDKDGLCAYKYGDINMSDNVDWLFRDQPQVTSRIVCVQNDTAVRFSRDANGVITGMLVKLNK